MLSVKRLVYIILIVAALGCIIVAYSINEGRSISANAGASLASQEEFLAVHAVEDGEKPRVLVLGNSNDERYGAIYRNVLGFCQGLHLAVTGEEHWDEEAARNQDLVIFCDAAIDSYLALPDLERFIAEGGKVILAAGLPEGEVDPALGLLFGLQQQASHQDSHNLVFEKPLLPLQPDEAYYAGASNSSLIKVSVDTSVYLRDADSGLPLLHTYAWEQGVSCLINGTFLADTVCMGLLTGAMGAILPDFIYPVLGVKAVFLDNFPTATAADDEPSRQVYGYSAKGFIQDEVWPLFQGLSLRTESPYTSSVLVETSSEGDFKQTDGELLASIGKSVLRFDGELVYGSDCTRQRVVFDEALLTQFAEAFPDYPVRGLVLETNRLFSAMLDVPGADIQAVRGMLESSDPDLSFSWRDDRFVFPAATAGIGMETGSLFELSSVLGAYGMVSHVFDLSMPGIWGDDISAWDVNNEQVGLFESEILSKATWLEGKTLTQTGDAVKSYTSLDYGWTKKGDRLELECSGAVKSQPFLYHSDSRITSAQGLDFQDVGNGYYLLRIQENQAAITLEEGR